MLSGVLMYRTGEFLVLYIRNIYPSEQDCPAGDLVPSGAGLMLNFAFTEFSEVGRVENGRGFSLKHRPSSL